MSQTGTSSCRMWCLPVEDDAEDEERDRLHEEHQQRLLCRHELRGHLQVIVSLRQLSALLSVATTAEDQPAAVNMGVGRSRQRQPVLLRERQPGPMPHTCCLLSYERSARIGEPISTA